MWYWYGLSSCLSPSVIVADLRPRDHVTAALMALHWLPVRQRITIQTIHSDACSRVWTRATVLDIYGGVCVTAYLHVSSMFSSKVKTPCIHTTFWLIEIVFCRSSTGVQSLAGWFSPISPKPISVNPEKVHSTMRLSKCSCFVEKSYSVVRVFNNIFSRNF